MFLFRKNKKKVLSKDISNTIFLQNIRCFWNGNPQYYQEHFKNASADEYLTYGKTLMLWGFKKASPLKSQFPVYMERECHISNPKKMQYELLLNSYIEPASLEEILSSYKMTDLKIIADSVGCTKSGKKAALIQRISENIDEDMSHSIILNSKLFSLSDKGKAFLNANYDYVELHRHLDYDISLYEYNQNRVPDGHRKRTFEDNIYTLVSERIYRKSLHRNYYMLAYDYHILYEIALSEQHFDIAIDNYLYFLYLKSCCIQTAQYYATDFPHSDFKENSEIIFTVQSAPPIVDLSVFYNISYIENIYNDKTLPPSFLSRNEFINLIEDMINSTSFDYTKYNELIFSRLKKYAKL